MELKFIVQGTHFLLSFLLFIYAFGSFWFCECRILTNVKITINNSCWELSLLCYAQHTMCTSFLWQHSFCLPLISIVCSYQIWMIGVVRIVHFGTLTTRTTHSNKQKGDHPNTLIVHLYVCTVLKPPISTSHAYGFLFCITLSSLHFFSSSACPLFILFVGQQCLGFCKCLAAFSPCCKYEDIVNDRRIFVYIRYSIHVFICVYNVDTYIHNTHTDRVCNRYRYNHKTLYIIIRNNNMYKTYGYVKLKKRNENRVGDGAPALRVERWRQMFKKEANGWSLNGQNRLWSWSRDSLLLCHLRHMEGFHCTIFIIVYYRLLWITFFLLLLLLLPGILLHTFVLPCFCYSFYNKSITCSIWKVLRR